MNFPSGGSQSDTKLLTPSVRTRNRNGIKMDIAGVLNNPSLNNKGAGLPSKYNKQCPPLIFGSMKNLTILEGFNPNPYYGSTGSNRPVLGSNENINQNQLNNSITKNLNESNNFLTISKSKVPDIQMINKYYGLIPKKFTMHSRISPDPYDHRKGLTRCRAKSALSTLSKQQSQSSSSFEDDSIDKFDEPGSNGRGKVRRGGSVDTISESEVGESSSTTSGEMDYNRKHQLPKSMHNNESKSSSGRTTDDGGLVTRKISVEKQKKHQRRGKSGTLALSAGAYGKSGTEQVLCQANFPNKKESCGLIKNKEAQRVIRIDLNNMRWEETFRSCSASEEEVLELDSGSEDGETWIDKHKEIKDEVTTLSSQSGESPYSYTGSCNSNNTTISNLSDSMDNYNNLSSNLMQNTSNNNAAISEGSSGSMATNISTTLSPNGHPLSLVGCTSTGTTDNPTSTTISSNNNNNIHHAHNRNVDLERQPSTGSGNDFVIQEQTSYSSGTSNSNHCSNSNDNDDGKGYNFGGGYVEIEGINYNDGNNVSLVARKSSQEKVVSIAINNTAFMEREPKERRGKFRKTISFDEQVLKPKNDYLDANRQCEPETTKPRRPMTASSRHSSLNSTPSQPPQPPKVLPWTQKSGMSLAERRSKLQKTLSIHSTESLDYGEGDFSDVDPPPTEPQSNTSSSPSSSFNTSLTNPQPNSSAYKEYRKPLFFQPAPEVSTMIAQVSPIETSQIQYEIEKVAVMLKNMQNHNKSFIDLTPGDFPEIKNVAMKPAQTTNHYNTCINKDNEFISKGKSDINGNPGGKQMAGKYNSQETTKHPMSLVSSANTNNPVQESSSHCIKYPGDSFLLNYPDLQTTDAQKVISDTSASTITVGDICPKEGSPTVKNICDPIPIPLALRTSTTLGTAGRAQVSSTTVLEVGKRRPPLRKSISISCEKELLGTSANSANRNEVNFQGNFANKGSRPNSPAKTLIRSRSTSTIGSTNNNNSHRNKEGRSSPNVSNPCNILQQQRAGSESRLKALPNRDDEDGEDNTGKNSASRNRKLLIKKTLVEINQSSASFGKKWGILGRPKTAPSIGGGTSSNRKGSGSNNHGNHPQRRLPLKA